jgi:hypothetical protein
MADWTPPDAYEGVMAPPAAHEQAPAPAPEPSAFDRIVIAIEDLYAREPARTRAPLQELRAASTEELEALFK